jgi:hydroxymethylglutaryl-CoA lyase
MTGAPRVEWIEVGPRDGLQSWPATLPTATKVGLIYDLLKCGFMRVEATSMVHPKWVPQLADAEAVLEALHDRLDRLRVLVPNVKGMERAVEAGVRNVAVTVAASESYNQHNLNRRISETLQEIAEVSRLGQSAGVEVDASVSVAFGCPYEGTVSPGQVLDVASRLVDTGIGQVALADTIGMANPSQVEDLVQTVRDALPAVRWGAHFHDTRGAAMANLLAALETGIDLFEGSVGGIGGSPFAPGAAGNICSEDALYMLEAMRIETGIEVERLVDVARRLEATLGSPLPGRLHALKNEPRATRPTRGAL